MNHYKTPCNPIDCEWYSVYTPCSLGDGCDKFKKYEELKSAIRTESATYYKTYIKRTQSVDHHFRQQMPVRKV